MSATVHLARRAQRSAIMGEDALDRIQQRHVATFDLLEQEELGRGTQLALDRLPSTVENGIEWLIAVASR